jgi:hypothetical protein
MGAYDLVLGMDWLEMYRPMVCDWLEKWVEFQMNGSIVNLQGIISSVKENQEAAIEQVIKWDSSNELWVVVLVQPTQKSSALTDQYLINGILKQIQDLIRQYEDIFQAPTTLPPSRTYDHAIALDPNASPINCRPCTYSLEQKDETER